MQIAELIRPLAQLQVRTPVTTNLIFVRTATKRAAGSKTSMKDSAGRRLGAKAGDGQLVRMGEIIYRQRGTKIYPGENMGIGRDHTLFANEPGYVRYYYDPFHPKRKLVGIAMSKEARLPTPHFAPRLRRFGHEVITDPEAAEREKNATRRKEFLAREKLDKDFAEREEKRLKRRAVLVNTLKELGVELTESEAVVAGDRLLAVQAYAIGGRSVEEAQAMADRDAEQDAKIAKEFRGDESLLNELPGYKELAVKIDSATTFDPDHNLIKNLSKEELDALAEKTTKAVEEIIALPERFKRRQVLISRALKQPCFSLKTRHYLLKKYTAVMYAASAEPQELSKEEKEKLVKDNKGKIVKRWNYERRRVEEEFANR